MKQTIRIPSVTGVDMELQVAGAGGRSYAFIVDWHIRLLIAGAWLLLAGLAVALSGGAPQQELAVIAYTPAFAIYALYHPVLEILMHGKTPGKRIAGIRIVKSDGSAPGVGSILVRNVFRLIDSLPFAYCIGLTAAVLTRNSVRIGDMAAGTLLVYDEPVTESVLGDLSGGAVQRLGLEKAEIARDLLRRWNELSSETRRALARQLLTPLGARPEGDLDDDWRRALEAAVR